MHVAVPDQKLGEKSMADMIELKEVIERVVLIAVETSSQDDTDECLDELSELVKTAGAVEVGRIVQRREKAHNVTYIGKGKVDEVKDLVFETEATGVVCDDELSPVQLKNLENMLGIKVMDRTMVILDIFAKRASTSEGKLQVELAQLKFAATRLVGLRSSLSRLGGGIGTRGPGEKKIEMDRRLIHERISWLKAQLSEVKKHRDLIRDKRNASNAFVVAIVGYTNAGKSTLLNALTGADVLSEDQLFATLDPTTRKLGLSGGQEVLLTDTVGFIRKLPHHLIEAFKSTLEEAKYADLILHVVNTASPEYDSQMLVVYDTLKSLGAGEKELITAFNKVDMLDETLEKSVFRDFHADKVVQISAKTGYGLDELKQVMEEIIRQKKVLLEKVYPYAEAGKIQLIRKFGELLSEEYRDDGIFVKAFVPGEMYGKLV